MSGSKFWNDFIANVTLDTDGTKYGSSSIPVQNRNEFEREELLKKALQYCNNRVKSMKKMLDKALEYPTDKVILDLLGDVELSRKALREVLPMTCQPTDTASVSGNIRDVIIESSPQIPLKITLLPLCAYPIRGAYNTYFDVYNALQNADNKPVLAANKRYTIVYNRVVKGPLVLAKGRCDNDNFEMKRVTNAISDALGIADSVDKFSFYYITTEGEQSKTEVSLLEEASFLGKDFTI